MEYVYEAGMEKTYLLSLVKAFRKTVTEGFFNFIIVDSVFDKIAQYGEIVGHSKTNGFKVSFILIFFLMHSSTISL